MYDFVRLTVVDGGGHYLEAIATNYTAVTYDHACDPVLRLLKQYAIVFFLVSSSSLRTQDQGGRILVKSVL